MISRIEAHNHRSFPKLAIDLDRHHVLAVVNGAGKSTLLDGPVLIGDMFRRQVLNHLLKRHKVCVFNAEFRKLPRVMSVKNCQDPAFNQLRHQLRVWFPEQ